MCDVLVASDVLLLHAVWLGWTRRVHAPMFGELLAEPVSQALLRNVQ